MALVPSAMKYQMKNDVNEHILMYDNSALRELQRKTQITSKFNHNSEKYDEGIGRKCWALRNPSSDDRRSNEFFEFFLLEMRT